MLLLLGGWDGAAALGAHAPLLRLKSEDFFRAPEEEVQRVFDFLGLERADVSLKAYEEAKVKKYVAAPRSVAAPLVAPPPPPFHQHESGPA